jgi:DNA polymerase elongation subunit (family B)
MSAPSSDGGFSAAFLSVRVVDIATYQMPLDQFSPAVAFQAARLAMPHDELPKLPTVRIFGCTPAGQKACVHLHGLRPYLYVPLPSSVPLEQAASFCDRLRNVLDCALAASLATPGPAEAGTTASRPPATAKGPCFVADVEPVGRTSMYGYHPRPSVYLRISVFNPTVIRRLAAMLRSGDGLGELSAYTLQPFESNFSFTLQVLTDLSLTGMGYINLSTCKFRLPLPPQEGESQRSHELRSTDRLFTASLQSLRPDLFWPFGSAARRTRCDIELDAFVEDVLNPIEHPGERQQLGQPAGPNAYAASTLRLLWELERLRTGRQPVIRPEDPRPVLAGPHLSDPRHVDKIRALLDRRAAEPLLSAPDKVEDCDDVMRMLDSSAREELTNGEACAAHCLSSDESAVEDFGDVHSSDDGGWEDIRECTQELPGVFHGDVPQGDGNGCRGRPDNDADDRQYARKRRRRHHRAGAYPRLELLEGADAQAPQRHQTLAQAGAAAARADGSAVHLSAPKSDDSGGAVAPSQTLPVSHDAEGCITTGAEAGDVAAGAVRRQAIDFHAPDWVAARVQQMGAPALRGSNLDLACGPPGADDGVEAGSVEDAEHVACADGGPPVGGDRDGSGGGAAGSFNTPIAGDVERSPGADAGRGNVGGRVAGIVRGSRQSEPVCGFVEVESEAGVRPDSQRLPREGGRVSPQHVQRAEHAERALLYRLKPARGAPSRNDVLGDFGVEALAPTMQHVVAYHGNPMDNCARPRPVAGVVRRIPVGGVGGLGPAEKYFSRLDDRITVARTSYILAAARPPPARQLILVDVLSGDGGGDTVANKGTSTVRMNRAVIDSAGRQVSTLRGLVDAERAKPPTFPSDAGVLSRPRWFRRRAATARGPGRDPGGASSSSGESEGGQTMSPTGNFAETAREQGHPSGQTVGRPSSPKYDERSFFPQTQWRVRKSTREPSHATDSPLFKQASSPADRATGGSGRVSGSRQVACSRASAAAHRGQHQNLCIAVVEVSATCHDQRLPDPRVDSILAVCVQKRDERGRFPWERDEELVLAVDSVTEKLSRRLSGLQSFRTEADLLDGLATVVQDFDPDVLAGFETQASSIGFLLDRAEALGHGFARSISRVVEADRGYTATARTGEAAPAEGDNPGARYFRRKGADINIAGRHVLNVWRIVRKDVKLSSYSLEGVAREVLGLTLPKHSAPVVERWLNSRPRADRALLHLCDKAHVCLAVLDKLDIVGRTGELARVYGIDFMSVLTRGSQFRVESMLARVAHPRGFILLAAQRDQVFDQPAVECLPLVMEPESGFYVDPVVVLDFQSLYPSMIIAHNLCFSTMLGNVNRLSSWSEPQQLGVVRGYRAPDKAELAKVFGAPAGDGVYVAPNGEMFVAAPHRRGILPQMLHEVLETRVMVKGAMKDMACDPCPNEELLARLNARQFAAKLLANVTYGFAAASASGRMPCAGLADSIVQCGRDALERIARYVQDELNGETGATVVYGDTDSLFVRVPGATKAEAFAVGRRICSKAQAMFPSPIKLQLEKVYMPCILVTKKRYVGYAFDSEDCVTPVFDAKGIETVRRDSCGVVRKAMEKGLRLLFEGRDISRVKRFFQRTCQRIQRNSIPLSEFIFRKEVRLGSYKKVLPPAAVVATRAMDADPRAAPRYKERVAFVVIFGGPGAALNDCVVSPGQFLADEATGKSRLHSTYYIAKQLVPSLDRLFSLLGVSVASWYAEMPRASFEPLNVTCASRIPSYFPAVRPCILCRGRCRGLAAVCDTCRRDARGKQASLFILATRQQVLESKRARLNHTCIGCVGRMERDLEEVQCVSLDCGVRFAKHRIDTLDMRALLGDAKLWDVD